MRKTRRVNVGGVALGGGADVSIQSMLNIPAENIDGSVLQARELSAAGCEIIRAAVPSKSAVPLIFALKENCDRPIVADIHFDYRIALECVAAGVDKIRINPGNIGDSDRIKAVADACRTAGIPIRIGVNSGSVEKPLLEKYGSATAQALAESALNNAKILERFNFQDIVISIKSSSVKTTYDASKLVAEQSDYPLHIGVTEAGAGNAALIKSAAGIGSLLLAGIGDTIRVSLTDNPVCEVKAARDILKCIGLRHGGVEIVSCPTCGRTKIDLIPLVNALHKKYDSRDDLNLKLAVMGCVVNGPGEAQDADFGIAGGDGCGVIFKKGEIIRKVTETELLNALISEIEN